MVKGFHRIKKCKEGREESGIKKCEEGREERGDVERIATFL